MEYEVTITLRRDRIIHQKQYVVAEFNAEDARKYLGLAQGARIPDIALSQYAHEVARAVARAHQWQFEGETIVPLDRIEDLDIKEVDRGATTALSDIRNPSYDICNHGTG